MSNVLEADFGREAVNKEIDLKLREFMEEAGVDLSVTVDLFRDGGIHVMWDHVNGGNEVDVSVVADVLRWGAESVMREVG